MNQWGGGLDILGRKNLEVGTNNMFDLENSKKVKIND